MTDDIPSDVRQFILTNIDSVPELEGLLLVCRHADKTWNEERLAKALYIQPPLARKIVQDMLRRGWIKLVEPSDEFTFNSAWDRDGEFMRKLSTVYQTKLVRVATLIHSNASSAVRDFAKAFDFKKD